MTRAIGLGLCVVVLLASELSCTSLMSAEDCHARGTAALRQNKGTKAYRYFSAAARKAPQTYKYHWMAVLSAPDRNAAFVHAKYAWDSGLRDRNIVLTLLRLSFHTRKPEKLAYALALFGQLPDSIRTDDFRGLLLFLHEEYDSCLRIWNGVWEKNPTPDLAGRIGQAYLRGGQVEKGYVFLDDCRRKKLLDGRGYVMLATSKGARYDYEGVQQLFDEARRLGLYSDTVQLEHAGFLLVLEHVEEARAGLLPLAVPAVEATDGFINHRARMLLALIYASSRDAASIASLAQSIPPDGSYRGPEQEFYKALTKSIQDSVGALEELRAVRRKLPADPAVELAFARENARAGRFGDAVEAYKGIPGLVGRSPSVLTELAVCLARAGKADEALTVVSAIHRSGVTTRLSLELFRDLTLRKDLIDKSEAAQRLLEKKYSGDTRVRWAGAVVAFKAGKADSALAIFEALAREFPKEARFQLARIGIYLYKKDYRRVVDECAASGLPADQIAPLQARAYRALGESDKAAAAYAAGLAKERASGLMLEYAEHLVTTGRFEEAAGIYGELLAKGRDGLSKDSLRNAVALNNLAWSLMQSPGSSDKAILTAARGAWDLSPVNPHIVDTYAEALLRTKKYKDVVRLLDKNPVAESEPQLLVHLASAFAGLNDANRAVRRYRRALELADSTHVLQSGMPADSIRGRIERLVAER